MAEEATVKKQPAQASTPEPEVPQASLNKFSNDGSFLKKFKEEMDSRQKNRCEKPLDKPAKQVTRHTVLRSSCLSLVSSLPATKLGRTYRIDSLNSFVILLSLLSSCT